MKSLVRTIGSSNFQFQVSFKRGAASHLQPVSHLLNLPERERERERESPLWRKNRMKVVCMCCVTMMQAASLPYQPWRLGLVFEAARAAEFGLQQPPTAAAAVKPAAAAAPPPAAAAGDHGDCGAYSVSILRQGPLPSREPAGPRALPALSFSSSLQR